MMRALTVWQPWAWAIVAGHKPVENRGTCVVGRYRGPLAIHAGKRPDGDAAPFIARILGSYDWLYVDGPEGPSVTGAVLGVVTVTGAHRREPGCCDTPWATDASWHIEVADPVRLKDPVLCLGRQSMWVLPPAVEMAVRDQVRAVTGLDGAGCTGVAARWCPRCGTCTCPTEPDDDLEEEVACPLHGPASPHAEAGLTEMFGRTT